MDSFIHQALLFIGSSLILVPLFQRFGFGSVLGYLIAGIAIGPNGFKLIGDSESIMHFSEWGVTLLLFMIGLEIQPRKLWSMRSHLIGLGGLQVLLTSLVFTLIALGFGLSLASSVVIGFGLSLSSTAFAMQTLTEKNQFNTEHGRSSFAVLLAQDLFAIPALALLPALSSSASSGFSAKGTFEALGIFIFLIFASRFLIRPIFRVIASTRSREVFTAASLFIALGVAALMLSVGLSAALGTFLAGVLLADSEYRHELESNVEPFKSLLMGLFFIAVGMSVNTGLIIHEPVTVFALTATYLLSKATIIYLLGRLFKMRPQSSRSMAVYIAQGGEFAFVIFGMALQTQILDNHIVDMFIAVITLSMAINPILSLVNDYVAKRKFGKTDEKYDEIRGEAPEVIIAGFGRFGQIFARILRAQNIPFVAMDHDGQQIELVRRFGSKVYYGDVTRGDLLEAAGIAKAKYFILAIDDVEASLQTAEVIRERWPHIKIFARARNRGHVYDLMDLKIDHIKRETLDSSIYFVRDLLVEMGFSPARAFTLVEKFKQHDEIMLKEQYKVRHDDKALVSLSNQGVAQLAQVLNDDTVQSYIGQSDQRL